MKKILSVGSVILVLMVTLFLGGCLRKQSASGGPATLSFYGLDNEEVFRPIIDAYKVRRPNVTIRYKKFNNPEEFENLLINEIAEGEGPDIFYIHNTWLPRHSKKLVPLQSESLTPQAFSDVFVNVVSQDFIQPTPTDGVRRIYALPLYVDTLALYYNKRDFERVIPERGKPAETWEDLKREADKFKEQDTDNSLTHGALALGRADNIKLAVDILYNLFLQAGVNFYDAEFKRVNLGSEAQEMFDYFLSFSVPQNKNYSWSLSLAPASSPLAEVETFLAGKVSAITGYSDLYQRLENDIKNVKTRNSSTIALRDIGVAKIPQVATEESDYKVWANYYGLAVSRNSKSQATAWDFIQFATSKDKASNYHKKTKRPTARRDLIEDQQKEPITEIFVSQVGYAGSFRIFSDKAFGDLLRKAITEANQTGYAREILGNVQTAMNNILEVEAPKGLYPKLAVQKRR